MKRLTVLLLAIGALGVLASAASAGDYHVGRRLICSDCHIAHGSQTHGYATDDTVLYTPTPHPYLLRGEDFNAACLNCHDGKGADGIPDVLGATEMALTNGRSAGGLNTEAGVDGYTKGMGHTLWSSDMPPGHGDLGQQTSTISGTVRTHAAVFDQAEGLECANCHRVHGNKYFRNLIGTTMNATSTIVPKQFWGKEVTYAVTLDSVTAGAETNPWVVEKTATGPTHYDNDNVQYLEPDTTKSMYGNWCGTCHEHFHGGLDNLADIFVGGEVVRHPTAGVNASTSSWPSAATHRLKVMANNKDWGAASPVKATPSCFTCHKSHGNLNRFGLIFVIPKNQADGETTPDRPNALTRTVNMTEEGDGGEYRNLCRNCHGMGSWPTGNPTNLTQ